MASWGARFVSNSNGNGLSTPLKRTRPEQDRGALIIAPCGELRFTSTAAAGGIALINSLGNLGGFAGPYMVGMVKQASHSFAGGMLVMAASVLGAGVLALMLPMPSRQTVSTNPDP